jgi:hypothetical protein
MQARLRDPQWLTAVPDLPASNKPWQGQSGAHSLLDNDAKALLAPWGFPGQLFPEAPRQSATDGAVDTIDLIS